ncbi:hypothetical protein AB0F59_29570 [Micromonospora lupini]|uniref:hypothetical protein n=1 Tax=Micromonospora lupini TaxID=285679 RepID=UPI00340AF146
MGMPRGPRWSGQRTNLSFNPLGDRMISNSSGVQVGDGNTQHNHYHGLPTPGVPLTEWWNDTWLPFTDPPLGVEIVLAGRQEQAAALCAALDTGPAVVEVGGELGALELKAFIAAALNGTPLGNRTLLIDDQAAFRAHLAAQEPRILAVPTSLPLNEIPLRRPHTILVYGKLVPNPAVKVPALDEDEVERHLSVPIEPDRARSLGILARRGLGQLWRALAKHRSLAIPPWARSADVRLRRLALLGGWHGDHDGDRAIVSEFTGVDNAEMAEISAQAAADPDTAMLGHLGQRWYVQAPEDTIVLLAPSFTEEDRAAFAGLAVRVLSTHGGSLAIRRGIAESLVVLAVRGGSADLVHRVVREVMSQANVSLADVLTYLAEASPTAFLDAVRTGRPSSRAALELLAWPTEHFGGAVEALARMAAAYPGSDQPDRPGASLAEIFEVTRPQTNAPRPVRLRALKRMLRDQPEVARTLLLDLLRSARHGTIGTLHPTPLLRDWPTPGAPPPAETYAAFRDVASLTLDDLDDDPERFLALIPLSDSLPDDQRSGFLERLMSLSGSVDDQEMRRRLSEALRELIALHIDVGDAPWAMPADELAPFRRAADALAPSQPADQTFWLFGDRWPQPEGVTRRRSSAEHFTALSRLRAEVVARILASGGLDALVALADRTGNGDLIGAALAESPSSEHDDVLLTWLSEDRPASRPDIAFEYFALRIWRGADYLDRTSDPTARARLLLARRDPENTDPGPEEAAVYWREFGVNGLGAEFTGVAKAAAGLIGVGRFAAALDLIAMYAEQVDTREVAVEAATACEGFVRSAEEDRGLSGYDLQIVVELLERHQDALGAHRVTEIELSLVPLLRYDARTPTIHARLAEDPAFFAELVETAFRAEGSDETVDDPDQVARIRAISQVLRSWRCCPGTGPDGTIDAEALAAWVQEARRRLSASGRLRLADGKIGAVLAFAEPDEDGSVPPLAVREVLEDADSDAMDSGLWGGLYNRRGVTWRGLRDGGAQERTLVERFREYERQAEGWPRSQRILRQLAGTYERESRKHDHDAEVWRRGIEW